MPDLQPATCRTPWRVALALATLACMAVAADEPVSGAASRPRCEVAVVSPVSGFAECVKPRGVPVEPPPPRPPPRAEECARHADLQLPGCGEPPAPRQ